MSIYLKDESSDTITRWEGGEGKADVLNWVWDPIGLVRVKMTQPGGGGGGGGDASAANQLTEITELQKLTAQQIVNIDKTSTTDVVYIGFAAIGSSNASAVWRIFVIDKTSGFAKRYAGGSSSFNKIWNNRTGYTYS